MITDVWSQWVLEPSIVAGLALLVGGYLVAVGPLRWRFPGAAPVPTKQVAAFLFAALLILIALVSPIDEIGDRFLFSMHMVQHILLAIVMPIFFLLGLPDWLLRPWLRFPRLTAAARLLTTPVVAFGLFNLSFAVYHLPFFYDLALRINSFHIAVHLVLMALGVLNWWPVLSPLRELGSLPISTQAFYLFLESMPTTALAAYIVLAATPLYATYIQAPRIADLSPLQDQQLAGIIMWLPGSLVYLAALTFVFFRWFGRGDAPLAPSR